MPLGLKGNTFEGESLLPWMRKALEKSRAKVPGGAPAEGNFLSHILGVAGKAPTSWKVASPLALIDWIGMPLATGAYKTISENREWMGLASDHDKARRFFKDSISDEEVEAARFERNMRSIERLAMASPDTLDNLHAIMTDSAIPRLTTSEIRVGGVSAMDREELNKALAKSTLMDRVRAQSPDF